MKTNFFENIAQLNIPGTWKMGIQTDDKGNFTVSALFTVPNGDSASKLVPPMLLKGNAQELDEGFFETIIKPAQETAGLFHNMEAYMKGLEEAKKQSKMVQDKLAEEKKQKTPGKAKENAEGIEVTTAKNANEEKKRVYEEAMVKISGLNDLCKYQEAIDLLPSVADYPEKKIELEKKLADLTRKRDQLAQVQLF